MIPYRHIRTESAKALRSGTLATLTLGISLLPFDSTRALVPNTGTLRVGPVYTSVDGKKSPEFPTLQMVVSQPVEGGSAPQQSELTLVEDGVEGSHAKAVTAFDQTGYGLAAVVAIDVSGSMSGGPLNAVRSSLYKFVSDARPQDSVGVMTIADDATWDVPFGSDQATTRTALQGLRTRGKLTKLYDGLITALGRFDSKVPQRRELTVISDGHDEGSQASLEQVVQMAHERGIAIDTIGLTRTAPKYLQTLSTLASETGGSFHQVRDDQELGTLISTGMARLKATPVAKFEAKHIPGDGKRHTVGVRWKGASNLAGDTAFLAPKLSTWQQTRAWVKKIPAWGYGVLGLLCAGLLLLVIATIRRSKRHHGMPDAPYELPRQPYPPGVPDASGHQAYGQQGNGFAGEPLSAEGFERLDTVGMKLASVAVPEVPPPVEPVFTDAPRAQKETRIAGVFNSPSGPIARLDVLTGAHSGRSVEVHRGEFWIGAAPENQFVLSNDATVSSRHAYLIFERPILILVDNQSTNGTRLNGKLLRGARHPLHDGDQIQIGQTLLRVTSND